MPYSRISIYDAPTSASVKPYPTGEPSTFVGASLTQGDLEISWLLGPKDAEQLASDCVTLAMGLYKFAREHAKARALASMIENAPASE